MARLRRAKSRKGKSHWPRSDNFSGMIDLHTLPSVASINGARIKAMTGDNSIPIPDDTKIILRAFRAVADERTFHVGFCIGNRERFSAIGIAVIERLTIEEPNAPIHVVPVVHEEIAWDLVLRHMSSFTGKILLFAFPNSDVYDAGTAEISYSKQVRQFDLGGIQIGPLTAKQRRAIRAQKAAILDRPEPPTLYQSNDVALEDLPCIFRFVTPAGKTFRTAVWNGRRDYAHIPPPEIARWVGGEKIAIVQVASPVGVDRRSSLNLTHTLAADFDGVIHWSKDTTTYRSIVKSFVRLDLEWVTPLDLPNDWNPEVVILAANE